MGMSTKEKCDRCGHVKVFTNRYLYARETDGSPLLCNACRYVEKARQQYHRQSKAQPKKKIIKKDHSGKFAEAFKSKTGRDINI